MNKYIKKIKTEHIITFALITLFIYFVSFETVLASGFANPKFPKAWKELIDEYRVILAGFSGIGALTSILVFVIHMIQLATMPTHPIKRRECIDGIMWSGICTMLLGGMTLVLTLFYSIIFL